MPFDRNAGNGPAPARVRREPPKFRLVAVRSREAVTPRLVRVVLAGADLERMADEPAASVRLLIPSPGTDELIVPTWKGNEFLLPDGRRPTIRTFTPRRLDPVTSELHVEVVLHGEGEASGWAAAARPGDPAAISGPGRGYAVDAGAPAFVLAGDESAVPAICQLLEVLPAGASVDVHIEVADPAARFDLPAHAGATASWWDLPTGAPPGDVLFGAVTGATIGAGTRVWVAGEAAAVQRIRRHLFGERALPRSQATVRGYWKRGRGGGEEDE